MPKNDIKLCRCGIPNFKFENIFIFKNVFTRLLKIDLLVVKFYNYYKNK